MSSPQPQRFIVYAPATSANLNVGFDALGLALQPADGSSLGDLVELELLPLGSPPFELVTRGPFASALPADPEQNVVTRCWRRFGESLSALSSLSLLPPDHHTIQPRVQPQALKPLKLTLHKRLPIGSGLGSSACSVTATLFALNLAHGEPLDQRSLLTLMGEMEGSVSGAVHYDNVAPSLLGGLQLILGDTSLTSGAAQGLSYSLPSFDAWRWVICYPGATLSTAEARAALPSDYARADTLAYGQALAGFVHACHIGDPQLAASLMRDVIAEPYRAPLISGLSELKSYERAHPEVLASGISGAGPTLFGLTSSDADAERLCAWMRETLITAPSGFAKVCRVDPQGARLIETLEGDLEGGLEGDLERGEAP